jgi:Tfp pilus assembly protein PilN
MRIDLDLLPENKKTVRLPLWIWSLALFMLVSVIFHYVFVSYFITDPKEIYEQRIADLKKELAESNTQMPVPVNLSDAAQKAIFINYIVSQGKIDYYKILTALEASIEPGTYIDEFVFEDQALILKGRCENLDTVYSMNKNLLASSFFRDIKMSHNFFDEQYSYIFRMRVVDNEISH